jgi:hypothetical protein
LYARNNRDKVQVRILDLKTGKSSKIFRYGKVNGLQETDVNYPLLAWSQDGSEISIVYEKRDIIYLRKHELKSGDSETQPFATEYQLVYSLSYVNEFDYVISANTDGFSDLYYYKSKTRESNRLTNDFYDDLEAKYVDYHGRKAVLFASNRQNEVLEDLRYDTILPIDDLDIYLLSLEEPIELRKVGEEHPYNQKKAIVIDEQEIAFVSAKSGIDNVQFIPSEATSRGTFLSNFDRNILDHDYHDGWYYYVVADDKRHYLSRMKIDTKNGREAAITQARIRNSSLTSSDVSKLNEQQSHKPWVINNNEVKHQTNFPEDYKFQSRFQDPEMEAPDFISEILNEEESIPLIPLAAKTEGNVHVFNQVRATASRLNFRIDDYSSKLDNSVLFEGLDSYAGERQEYNYTPMGILMKGTVKDLFEDYIIEGGIRIPTSFSGSEIFLVLDDKKKRLDKRYALYRRSQTNRSDIFSFAPDKSRKNSLIAMYQLRYPLDIFTSLRLTTTLRNDRFYYLASDQQSFNEPIDYTQRLGLRLEYVFDNTTQRDLNLLVGARYKIYAEGLNRFDIQIAAPASFQPSNAFMTVLGADARSYLPLDNKSIFAIRLAGATSFGSERNMFFLGGVENWILPQFEQNIPLSEDTNFAYKTIAPNVRGFSYNIRNGSTFALMNNEIRIPLFNYFTQQKIRYSFLRHFQLIGFFDAGMAWYGASPYSNKNPLNSIIIENPPTVKLEVNYFRDPIVMGYGFGFRSMILGYFVRFDYAWGIETRQVQDPRLYISFGTDF